MALHRIRAQMRFTSASGLARWARSQLSVRYGQAVHINPGMAREEVKNNKVEVETDYENYICDLPLADLTAAEDAFTTLTDVNVLGQAVNFPNEDDSIGPPSWVEHHTCYHDEVPSKPCVTVNKKYSPDTSSETISPWEQRDSANPYMIDDKVSFEGSIYESTIDNNTWSPTGYPQGWSWLYDL